jgi:6-phosphofructokinase 1
MSGNAVIGQSGGPTVVINQSLVGVIEKLREVGGVDKILGAHHAVAGIKKSDFIDLTDVPQDKLERIALTPAAALGSSRDKPDAEYCKKICEVFEQNNVRYFFYIGGNDSSDTCRIVNETAQKTGYDLVAYHVPKTIDNDLVRNDHTPGYPSAAKFVAQAFMGDDRDNAALPGIKINVVMGRHAGFLTAASVLARQKDGMGPHLIYVPEVGFDEERFCADIEEVMTKRGRCLVAVSEGIHDDEGTPMATKMAKTVEKDAHGNVQLSGSGALGDFLANLVKTKLGAKRVRADTFGYLQRSFAGLASEVDQAEARQAGQAAVEHAMKGEHPHGSIAIERVSDSPYQSRCVRIEISDVAAQTKTLDKKYVLDGRDIDPSFKDYLLPLVGSIPTNESF